ncbi:conserved hypothetical protein [[Clostridium] ultunense Esp]|uniref:Uncharacterized protein n=1 Tax=[Clostridium] ultunense Esp TaxID=1288971 RepID=M1ZBM1_9FIRM|nr:hypothetical protein [Schnuerera ultunensis]CCQ95444.1 conserved hypothetical protein [[Clostridium] ultunense Esp]SHD76961.1 Putative uncharacterized protein [[Clostridium] ultunense Esp]
MKRFYYRYRRKSRKIIGVVLGIIGMLIIINIIPIEILFLLIGIILVIMGFLILRIK